MTELDALRQAELLVRHGRPDSEVERLTGVSLSEILSLRAHLAVVDRPTLRADRFSGHRWWRREG